MAANESDLKMVKKSDIVEIINWNVDSQTKKVLTADDDSLLVLVGETMSECYDVFNEVFKESNSKEKIKQKIKKENTDQDSQNKKEENNLLVEKVKLSDIKRQHLVKKLEMKEDSNYFDIQVLSLSEQEEEFKKRKNSENYNLSVFKCEYCYRGFNDGGHYRKHLKNHNWKKGKFKCRICKLRFKYNNNLEYHILDHKYLFSCKICPFKTYTRTLTKRHMKYHLGVEPKCEMCRLSFCVRQQLLFHNRKLHRLDYICVVCGFSFLGEDGLRSHVRLKHGPVEIPSDGPKCDECDLTFADEEAISTHRATSLKHGGGQKLYKLLEIQCKLKMNGYYLMKNDIECEQCGVICTSMMQYKGHFDSHHREKTITEFPGENNTFVCFVCGKTFPTQNYLETHLGIHEIPGRSYTCKMCKMVFKTRVQMKKHKNTHNMDSEDEDNNL